MIQNVSFANIEKSSADACYECENKKSWKKMKNETVEEVITTWKVTKKTYRRKEIWCRKKLLVYKNIEIKIVEFC
mgnify:CR=1 FL=1